MKKIKDWIQQLPADVRQKAFTNADADLLEVRKSSLESALYGAFLFDDTPEGHDYWSNIANSK